MTEQNHRCKWSTERIDRYLEDELSVDETATLERHLKECADCAGAVALARLVVDGLRELPQLSAPPGVTASVFAQIRQRRRQHLVAWFRRWRTPVRRPLLAGGLAFAIGLLVWIHLERRDEPTDAELALARSQVEWTLAYLSQMGYRTGVTAQNEVFGPRIVKPIRRTMEMSLSGQTL